MNNSPRQNIFNISIDQPFLPTLAKGILERFASTEDPLSLARVEVLLPNRRSCLVFAELLQKQSGKAHLLLPRIRPIGDREEELTEHKLPVKAARTLALLATIQKWFQEQGQIISEQDALLWAEKLCDLQDACARNQADSEALHQHFPLELAAHRENTLALLKLVQHSPLPSPETLRNQMLLGKVAQFERGDITHPVIAAGSLGTIPATRTLLKAILRSPQGMVVVPGLDIHAEAAPPLHPQFHLQQVLTFFGLSAKDVLPWHPENAHSSRAACVRQWMQMPFCAVQTPAPDSIQTLECDTAAEEAHAIALALRETLETEQKTAILITPDRALARQVSLLMRQWHVVLDDSAGLPLSQTPLCSFFLLVLQAALHPASALALLAMLKHPLCNLSRHEARDLELRFFRRNKKPTSDFYTQIEQALRPLQQLVQKSGADTRFADLLQAHCAVFRSLLSLGDLPESASFEAAMQELEQAAADHVISGAAYADVLRQLLKHYTYRPPYGMHPRLQILTPQEARLIPADLVIISTLNDTAWPGKKAEDWLGQRARRAIGLPALEEEFSHAAHDFTMALSNPEILLTRARYEQGAPQNPHPWWIRLKTITEMKPAPQLEWARQMQHIAHRPITRIPPKVPLHQLPTRLSATDIRDLLRQPYRFYARKILKLEPLNPLPSRAEAKEIGNALHKALEYFVLGAAEQAEAPLLIRLMEQTLFACLHTEAEKTLWRARLPFIAENFLHWHRTLQEQYAHILAEATGEAALSAGNIRITLHAKADRIQFEADRAVIVDYKTGRVPEPAEIISGKEPQLLIEKWILERGGYPDVSICDSVCYWPLHSNATAAEGEALPLSVTSAEVEQQLHRLLTLYYEKNLPFFAFQPEKRQFREPYLQLSRVEEALL